MNKHETLQKMAELLNLQEDAIQQHPADITAVYVKGRDAFIKGQRITKKTKCSPPTPITSEDLSLMHRYMLSSAFVSAWYHLAGDKAKRDKLANSCCFLVASLGLDPEQAFFKYVEYEQLWRQNIKDEGVAPHRSNIVILITTSIYIFIKTCGKIFKKIELVMDVLLWATVLVLCTAYIKRQFISPNTWLLIGFLLFLGAGCYLLNIILIRHYIRKRAPDFANDYLWEFTAGMGIVPKWVSKIGIVSLSCLLAACFFLLLKWQENKVAVGRRVKLDFSLLKSRNKKLVVTVQ